MKTNKWMTFFFMATAVLFMGCNNNNPANDNEETCWEATSGYTMDGRQYSSTVYLWATKNDMEKTKSAFLQVTTGGSYSYKKASANDEASCVAMYSGGNEGGDGNENGGTGEEKCWQVTYQFPGSSETGYTWGTEENIIIHADGNVADYKSNYGWDVTYTYKEVTANDLNSCFELNY